MPGACSTENETMRLSLSSSRTSLPCPSTSDAVKAGKDTLSTDDTSIDGVLSVTAAGKPSTVKSATVVEYTCPSTDNAM